MTILFIGDVVGSRGRAAVGETVRWLRRQRTVDFVIVNCENASGGKGIDPRGAEELYDAGADVLTSGNHVWQHGSIVDYIRDEPRLLRPLNFSAGVPGRGWGVRQLKSGRSVGVVNLIGRAFMAPAECPFRAVEGVLEEMHRETRVVVVDMHCEATAEKAAMGHFLDGRVSAVIGTHTHVQTADSRVLSGGTAYITDVGMCGPEVSILGVRRELALRRFLTQMPVRFEVAGGPTIVCGAVVDVDDATGRARSIDPMQKRIA